VCNARRAWWPGVAELGRWGKGSLLGVEEDTRRKKMVGNWDRNEVSTLVQSSKLVP